MVNDLKQRLEKSLKDNTEFFIHSNVELIKKYPDSVFVDSLKLCVAQWEAFNNRFEHMFRYYLDKVNWGVHLSRGRRKSVRYFDEGIIYFPYQLLITVPYDDHENIGNKLKLKEYSEKDVFDFDSKWSDDIKNLSVFQKTYIKSIDRPDLYKFLYKTDIDSWIEFHDRLMEETLSTFGYLKFERNKFFKITPQGRIWVFYDEKLFEKELKRDTVGLPNYMLGYSIGQKSKIINLGIFGNMFFHPPVSFLNYFVATDMYFKRFSGVSDYQTLNYNPVYVRNDNGDLYFNSERKYEENIIKHAIYYLHNLMIVSQPYVDWVGLSCDQCLE